MSKVHKLHRGHYYFQALFLASRKTLLPDIREPVLHTFESYK